MLKYKQRQSSVFVINLRWSFYSRLSHFRLPFLSLAFSCFGRVPNTWNGGLAPKRADFTSLFLGMWSESGVESAEMSVSSYIVLIISGHLHLYVWSLHPLSVFVKPWRFNAADGLNSQPAFVLVSGEISAPLRDASSYVRFNCWPSHRFEGFITRCPATKQSKPILAKL